MKGREEALKLKKRLYALKNEIVNILTSPSNNNLTIDQRKIYQSWLGSINDLITICEERNRF